MSLSVKQIALPAGPILALLAGYLMYGTGLSVDAAITLGVTTLVIVWWIFEPIPIPATSLIPLAVLPLTGVLTSNQIGEAYGSPLVLLLLGGFILATALEKNGAHRRIAITMVRAFGSNSSRRLVFGFMAASAFLSMWISNTATTLMMLPVALAVLEKAEDPKLATPLLLGIAYAASVGGIGTPIGTPPNIVFMGVYADVVGEEFGFAQWMAIGVPVVLVMLPLMGYWLTRNLTYRGTLDIPPVGKWQKAEVRVLIVFGATALLWVTRKEPFGGWTEWAGVPYSNDAIVAFLAAVAMFLIPDGRNGRLLDWETANKIPWGMLILFGAGIAIAQAFTASGLSATIGNALAGISTFHIMAIMGIICLAVTFMTEATSNTATTTLLMPILAAAALGANMDPRLFMIPAAMSASCAFMLPVATAPNIVMFSTGRFSVQTMAKEGFALNLIGVVVISTLCYLLVA
ncbi:MAG: SLC13 family permease [Gammaproteobacteria bacterium]|nr:SLC13 family permease [Gammaproteobacteria bacterium]